MPVEIALQDTKLSFAYAVNKVQDICTINEADGKLKTSGKAVTRFLANSVLAVAALVETVVKVLFVALTLGLHNGSKAALSLAKRTTVEAFKGTLGFSTPKVIVETPPPPPPPPVEETPPTVVTAEPAREVEPKPKTRVYHNYWEPTRTERFVKAVKQDPAFTTLVATVAAVSLNMIFNTNTYITTPVNLTFCFPALYGVACGIEHLAKGYANQIAYIARGVDQAATYITKTKPSFRVERFAEQIKEAPLEAVNIGLLTSVVLNFVYRDSYITSAANYSFCLPAIYGIARGFWGFTEGYADQVAQVGSYVGSVYSKVV